MDNCGKIRDGFQKNSKSLKVANNTNNSEIYDRKTTFLLKLLELGANFGQKYCFYRYSDTFTQPFSHMLVQVICVLQYNSLVSLGFLCVTCNTRKIYL